MVMGTPSPSTSNCQPKIFAMLSPPLDFGTRRAATKLAGVPVSIAVRLCFTRPREPEERRASASRLAASTSQFVLFWAEVALSASFAAFCACANRPSVPAATYSISVDSMPQYKSHEALRCAQWASSTCCAHTSSCHSPVFMGWRLQPAGMRT